MDEPLRYRLYDAERAFFRCLGWTFSAILALLALITFVRRPVAKAALMTRLRGRNTRAELPWFSEHGFHEEYRSETGRKIGRLGAMSYILDDSGRPISLGFHRFREGPGGRIVGVVGALTVPLDPVSLQPTGYMPLGTWMLLLD